LPRRKRKYRRDPVNVADPYSDIKNKRGSLVSPRLFQMSNEQRIYFSPSVFSTETLPYVPRRIGCLQRDVAAYKIGAQSLDIASLQLRSMIQVAISNACLLPVVLILNLNCD
jgi:hypothetical protein